MGRVERHPQAETDADEIWFHIAGRDVAAADRMIDRLDAAVETLSNHPLSGRSREELRPLVRSRAVGSYVIFYEPMPDGVILVRVLNGARDLPRLFDSED